MIQDYPKGGHNGAKENSGIEGLGILVSGLQTEDLEYSPRRHVGLGAESVA